MLPSRPKTPRSVAFRAEQDPLERVREVRLLYGAVVPSRRGQRRLVDEVREVGSELGESCVAAMQLAGEYAPLYQSGQQKPALAGILKPSDGLEPSTPSLPWRCSTN
jgi:hypothetical protein